MMIPVWQGKDYVETDVPDAILRPLVEYMLKHREWDRNLPRLARIVNTTRLDITDLLLQQAQAKDLAEAETILAAVEIEAPSAEAIWEQNSPVTTAIKGVGKKG